MKLGDLKSAHCVKRIIQSTPLVGCLTIHTGQFLKEYKDRSFRS
jgi:hypothetical protein